MLQNIECPMKAKNVDPASFTNFAVTFNFL